MSQPLSAEHALRLGNALVKALQEPAQSELLFSIEDTALALNGGYVDLDYDLLDALRLLLLKDA